MEKEPEMLRTNEKKLVKLSVMGEITHPTFLRTKYNIGANGALKVLPGVGGISYNCRVGDSAVEFAADHVEPGVTIKRHASSSENDALNTFACVGNMARVVSGEAKGKTGTVTGKHGGVEHIHVDFPEDVKATMTIGDRIQITAYGCGLELVDYPEIKMMNCSPELLKAMKIKEPGGGRLEVGVAAIIPAVLMGAGLGSVSCNSGDCDIQMFDTETVEEHGLAGLRLGDIVAINGADHSYGRIFRKKAVTVGIVVHTGSIAAGHGPGMTTLMTSSNGDIDARLDQKANLADILGLRKMKRQSEKKK